MSERLATDTAPVPAQAAPPSRPAIPGYEIFRELGRGGMGVVYEARHVSSGRLVALKLIRDGALAGPTERARFRLEAEAAAGMRHPNIVRIYEVGENKGQPWFAMELAEQGSLDQHIAGRPQPARHAAGLVRALALAVQHAHEHNVIHRDLKPSNVLLVSGGVVRAEWSDDLTTHHSPLTTHQPRITDFGLAKRLDSESTVLTRDGAILGTAGYMAPEQAAGRVREVGPAVDVYALGAILYELLAGRPPFRADDWARTVEQVLHDEPVPPTRHRLDVPPDLETICLKCLEKEPARRYTSAADLADDLERFLAGRRVIAVPLGAGERLGRLAARDGYRIVAEIGRGPRSTVYHALYGPLGQPMALKVFVRRTCARQEWEARLRRGAEIRAALTHPQIVLPQQAGWWDDAPYVAAEYVPHGSVAARLTGRPQPLREALHLAEQLAEIVGYLHRQGVVHGNLKPDNVLLAADGIPRLVDFRPTGGLFQEKLPLEDDVTAGLGSVAPEIVQDPLADHGPYTDIYGLGTILYELLTGRPPFAGTTAQEILEQLRSQDPIPPSQFNSKVTPQLDALCLRCLRKNPWRRYYRAYDVAVRLRDFQDNPEGRPPSGDRRRKRRPSGQEDVPRAT